MGRASSVPFCIIGKCSWGVVQALKVPESEAPRYVTKDHGWMVLIRDSDMPMSPPVMDLRLLRSNPRRLADEGDGA